MRADIRRARPEATAAPARVAYVVKRYPRFSETFIVNEILAHEAAGLSVEVFALYPPTDTHFQDSLARVRAPVTYLTAEGLRATDLWQHVTGAAEHVPAIWDGLAAARTVDARVVSQAARLAAALVSRGITHVHAHFATVAADVARLASAWTGVPYSVTAHAKDIFHESVTPTRLRQVLEHASTVVTVSDFNRQYLTGTVGLPAPRVRRIYNGLDLVRFSMQEPAAPRQRIIAVGRLVAKKGFDVLLDACALLRSTNPSVHCDIVGTGECEGALRAQATALGLDGHVRFHGAMPQSMVMQLVREAAVFAAPCVVAEDGDRDGLPTVLLESMALGTPVVATRVVGIPEIVEDGVTGLLVEERDPAALAAALRRLVDSAGLRRTLAVQARRFVERHFDIERSAAALRDVFGADLAAPMARAS